MWILSWLCIAHATQVPDGLRPVAVPVDAPAQYAAYLEKKGLTSEPLACRPLWEGYSLLCFRLWEQKRRRWVTEADLASWKVTLGELAAQVGPGAQKVLREQLETVPVEGTEAHYVRVTDGDGWAASVALAPEMLGKTLGTPYLAAIPAEGIFVAWAHGDPELDHIMAVGVRELYDEQPGSVSPFVHAWDGEKWTPFGEAKPSVATPGSPH